MPDITKEELKRILNYSPETGIFVWKIKPASYIKIGDIAGHKDTRGYIAIMINGKSYKAHRLAFLYMEGYFPEHDVDHIDRNPSNNTWNNLRHVSRQCNNRNCKIQKNNTSGVTGVRPRYKNNTWIVQIVISEKNIHLGSFKNFIDAVKARWQAEIKYGYPNCNTTSAAYQYLKEHGGI